MGRAGFKLNQAWVYPPQLSVMGFSILLKTTADSPGSSPRRADHHEATLVGPLCARAPPLSHRGQARPCIKLKAARPLCRKLNLNFESRLNCVVRGPPKTTRSRERGEKVWRGPERRTEPG